MQSAQEGHGRRGAGPRRRGVKAGAAVALACSLVAVSTGVGTPQAVARPELSVPSPPSVPVAAAARWAWPLAAVSMTKPYSAPANAYGPGHRGIDLAAEPGTAVTAPADGVVWFSGVVVDRPVLTLDHGDGVLSSYEPLDSRLSAGDVVHRGDSLGVVDSGGHCSADCLHIGVRVDKEYVSPLLFFARVPHAVLLPLRQPAG